MATFVAGSKSNNFASKSLGRLIYFSSSDTPQSLLERPRFSWTNPEILKDFKEFKFDRKEMLLESYLVESDKKMNREEAIKACTNDAGWQLAKLHHLLSYLSSDSLYDKEKKIICLDYLDGKNLMPTSFFSEETGKILDLFNSDDLTAECSFLLVRPVKSF